MPEYAIIHIVDTLQRYKELIKQRQKISQNQEKTLLLADF